MTLRIPLLAACLALCTACSQQQAEAPAGSASSQDVAAEAAGAPGDGTSTAPPPPPSPRATGREAAQSSDDTDLAASRAWTQADGTRRFIRTAAVRGRVDDVERASGAIEDLAARHGGFTTRSTLDAQVQSVHRRRLGGTRAMELTVVRSHARVQVRVPSERAPAFLRALRPQLRFIDERSVEALDAQFELLRAQLAQSRARAAAAALADARADGGRLGAQVDAIAVRAQVQAEQDAALLAEREFEDRIAFATLDFALVEGDRLRRTEVVDIDAALDREGPPYLQQLADALRSGWDGTKALVVVLVAAWPLWLVAGLALFACRAWRGRARGPNRRS